MRRIWLVWALWTLVRTTGAAQVAELRLGVNGLTCAQCTRNVEMQLRRLPFVAEVQMDLQHTSGVIRLKEGASFLPEAVVKAVGNAGFSVRYLSLVVRHPATYRTGDRCLTIAQLSLQVVGEVPAVLPDAWTLQLLGRPFQPAGKTARPPQPACPASRYFVTIIPGGG